MDFQIQKKLFFYLEKRGGEQKAISFHHRYRAPRDPVAHRSHRTIAALVARCLVPSLWPSGQPCDASPSEAGFTGPQHVFFWRDLSRQLQANWKNNACESNWIISQVGMERDETTTQAVGFKYLLNAPSLSHDVYRTGSQWKEVLQFCWE